MPARSKSQQRLFGMVHAVQTGKLKKSKVSKQIRRMAKSISPESVSHFARTKHKRLPNKKSEDCGTMRRDLRGLIKFAQIANLAGPTPTQTADQPPQGTGESKPETKLNRERLFPSREAFLQHLNNWQDNVVQEKKRMLGGVPEEEKGLYDEMYQRLYKPLNGEALKNSALNVAQLRRTPAYPMYGRYKTAESAIPILNKVKNAILRNRRKYV